MSTKTEAHELAALTRAVRAHVAWQAMTGAHALPSVPVALPAGPSARIGHDERPPTSGAREALPPPAPRAAALAPAPAAPVLSSAREETAAQPARSLDVLRDEVAQCNKCALHSTRARTVFARGNPQASLMIVGEGPGEADELGGEPFIGPAGELLDRMVRAMGLDPTHDVYVCNVMKCRPPDDRKAHMAEVKTCAGYLEEQIAAVRPKVILACGNTAIAGLLGSNMPIGKLRGQWKLYKGETLLMPTYHPSFLLRPFPGQAEAKRQTWSDLQAVMKELGLAQKS